MKKDTKESIGTVGGGVIGTGAGTTGSIVAVSAAGTGGLSGAGIMSGLTAIGGSAIGGIAVLTCGTAVVAGVGAYGGYKLVKKFWK
ncbi:MAG: hypothetical protein ACOC33_00610 [bacterium]